MPDWVEQGYQTYAKRLRGDCALVLTELAQTAHGSAGEIRQREGQQLLGRLRSADHVVCLDVRGQPWNTAELSRQLDRWKSGGKPVALVIGGPEGLSEEVLKRADQRWSLSALTFPHPLVRVIVAEQLYRAESILRNHPYHRA